MSRRDCAAQRFSDQMICAACGLIWDTDDDEPPACHRIESVIAPYKQPTVAPTTSRTTTEKQNVTI